jgi:hypothetical protein
MKTSGTVNFEADGMYVYVVYVYVCVCDVCDGM